MASGVRITEAQFDFSGGVDSSKVPILRSELVPTGLKRNQLAWLNNATCRGGGITCRTGWDYLTTAADGSTLFQGGWLYDDSARGHNPYLILSIGGHIIMQQVEPPYANTDLSVVFGLFNPATEPKAFFIQGEEFLVIQAGDLVTLPLFWDGVILRRSLGLAPNNIDPYFGPVNELPAGTCMDYYMGRIWIGQWNGQRRQYAAGDIVQNFTSGTAPYNYRDSVLKVTENPLAIGGDGFTVPSSAGDIRAINHAASLDTALGDGPLFVFTRKAVYKTVVPVTRANWIAADANHQPIQTLAQKINGTYSDRSVVPMSGDLFYQSPDGIRSLMLAIRYFNQWGNTPISNNEERALQFNDRSLMRFSSGMEFDNRLWQTALPVQKSAGVVFPSVLPLDFDLVSSLDEKFPPAWEGMYEGLDFLQLWSGDFGGLQRAFGATISRHTGQIEIWEMFTGRRFDAGTDLDGNNHRIQWLVEFPGYTWAEHFPSSRGEIELKTLDGGELWIDKLFGTVEIEVYYRVDADPCWQLWFTTSICAAKTSCEDVNNPVCYPEQPYREGYKFPVTFPKPPLPTCETMNKRPMNIGYVFQIKVLLKGWCRIRGLVLHAIPTLKAPFQGVNC